MNKFSDIEKPMGYGTPARARALVSLLAPCMAIGFAIHALLSKGYNLSDYFMLIYEGEVDRFSQFIGIAALVLWVLRYWPAAIAALRTQNFITWHDGELVLSSGRRLAVSEIDSLGKRNSLITKAIEFRLCDGSRYSQSTLFADEPQDEIIGALLRALGERTSSPTPLRT